MPSWSVRMATPGRVLVDRVQLARLRVLGLRGRQHGVALAGHLRSRRALTFGLAGRTGLESVSRRRRPAGRGRRCRCRRAGRRRSARRCALRSIPCSLPMVGTVIFLVKSGACCAGVRGRPRTRWRLVLKAVAAAVVATSAAQPTRPVRDGITRDSFSPGAGTAGRAADEYAHPARNVRFVATTQGTLALQRRRDGSTHAGAFARHDDPAAQRHSDTTRREGRTWQTTRPP